MLDNLIRDIYSVWKYILFKKRLIWAGKKLETLSPNKKPVSNESCLPHGVIPPFKISCFWDSEASLPQTNEGYFLAPDIPKFFLFHLNDLRQGSYLIYINGGKQHAHLNLKLTFLTFKMKHE